MRKIGIAITGGGIKSFSAIGVLKYLDELYIKPTYFAGTSMGSVLAGFLAAGMSIEELEKNMEALEDLVSHEKIVTPNIKSLKNLLSISTGYADTTILENKLADILSEYNVQNIKDAKKPVVIPSVDLVSGKLVLFTNRKNRFSENKEVIIIDDIPLSTAITASCSFPFVFKPRKYENMVLVDGGVYNNLPVHELIMLGAEMTISVSTKNIVEEHKLDNMFDIGKRVMTLMSAQSTLNSMSQSDLNINVEPDTENPFDLDYGSTAIKKGYEEAKKEKEELLKFKKESEKIFKLNI